MTAEEFNALFRAQLTELTRFLARRVEPGAVEDIASELFALAWQKRSQIPSGLELPWLYKSARYLIFNHNRKEAGRSSILQTLSEPVAAPSAEAIAIADLELARAWSELAPKDREVLSLWALEGLETKEVAAALGIGLNAANIRLSRAKKNLLNNLENS